MYLSNIDVESVWLCTGDVEPLGDWRSKLRGVCFASTQCPFSAKMYFMLFNQVIPPYQRMLFCFAPLALGLRAIYSLAAVLPPLKMLLSCIAGGALLRGQDCYHFLPPGAALAPAGRIHPRGRPGGGRHCRQVVAQFSWRPKQQYGVFIGSLFSRWSVSNYSLPHALHLVTYK